VLNRASGNPHEEMFRKIVYIFLFCLPLFAFSQGKNTPVPKDGKKIFVKHASSLSYDVGKSDAKVLKGDVICEHEGAVLRCDTALIFDKTNTMNASGNILITKGDSIKVSGDKLFYDGKTKIATLQGNVRCIEKDMVLTTGILTFDVGNSVANYYNGGKIVNKENTLTSKNGHYYSSSKELAFHYDVELVNPSYKMKSDTLRYNTLNKTSYFLGPSMIISKTDYIYCENGWYDTEKEKARFSKNALLVTKEQKLTGDSLFYDRSTKTGRAYKNIRLIDTAQKSLIYGDYAEYKEKNSEALVTKNAVYARIFEQDTLFVAADTLYHRDIDSVHNFLSAYHKVKILKKDFQAMCDSAALDSKDSLLQLFRNPVLWSGKSQVTGKHIKILTGANTIRGFVMEGNAFLLQLADSLNRYNQLSGKRIEGIIMKDTIRKVIVNGNAEIYYFPRNANKTVGMNKTKSSEIILWFKNEDIERVTIKPKTDGSVDPIKEVNENNMRLKGFQLLFHKRPSKRAELHTVDNRG
jgi:lipopolysaccharide export system protein LptA